jgi:hypothetical protein
VVFCAPYSEPKRGRKKLKVSVRFLVHQFHGSKILIFMPVKYLCLYFTGNKQRNPRLQGEVLQGEAIQGEASQNEASQNEAIQGEAIQGEAIQGEAIQGEAIQGEAIQGEAIQGDLGLQCKAAQGEAVQIVGQKT